MTYFPEKAIAQDIADANNQGDGEWVYIVHPASQMLKCPERFKDHFVIAIYEHADESMFIAYL